MSQKTYPNILASYTCNVFNVEKLQSIINEAVDRLKDLHFEAIAFRGNSGALFAAPLSLALKKPMIMVRKTGVSDHGQFKVEGRIHARSYIIVDDFVDSGDTIRAIHRDIEEINCEYEPECVAILTYQSRDNSDVIDEIVDEFRTQLIRIY